MSEREENDLDPLALEKRVVRRKIGLGVLIGLGGLLLYLMVYPLPLIYLESRHHFDRLPGWVMGAIEFSVIPHNWLYEVWAPFETYIDWVDSRIWK